MRTLKKVLALSLVFAMAFTMMAGAAFKDQDKIDPSLTSDIQLLTALGVFKGDENGNFNPTDNVRRSEAAKMIYVLKNNGVDDGAVAFQGVSKYSDVPVGHWAEGYINYCTNLGYMGGWQENGVQKFDPNGNVTGVELMKMLLCMIGYKADVQGYTGNGWQTNVLVDAATSGLSVEFVPSVYGATPRQWTARLMTNALDAYAVSYNKGELTYDELTYAAFALKLNTKEGILTDAGKVALSYDDKSETVNGVALDDDGEYITVGGVSFKTTVDASLLGQDVKVYYRAGTTTDTHKVYAVLATGDSKVYETTLGDVTVSNKMQDEDYESIKFEGYNNGVAKKYTDKHSIVAVYNLNTVDTLTPAKQNPANTEVSEFASINGNSSNPVRFVDVDNNGYIDLAFVTTTQYAIVDEYNTDKNILKFKDAEGDPVTVPNVAAINNTAIDSAEEMDHVKVEGTIAEDDVVAINIDTTSGKQMVVVSKVEPMTSSVTAYTLNSDGKEYNTVTINGTSTKFGKFAMAQYDKSTDNGTVLNDTTFYTDGKYIIYSTGGEATVSVENLAYVTAANLTQSWGEHTYKVRVLLANGSTGEYTVAASYDAKGDKITKEADLDKLYTSSTGTAIDQVYSYSISGDEITLRALKNDSTTTFESKYQKYNYNSKKVEVASDNLFTTDKDEYAVADTAYFFVKNSKDENDVKYSVVKASELNKTQTSITDASFGYKDVSGIPTFLFGVLELESSVVSSEAEYAFVKTVANYALVDGDHLAQMTVILPDGTEEVIQKEFSDAASAKDAVADWNAFRGNVVTYEIDVDGYVDGDVEAVTVAKDSAALADETWNKLQIVGWNNSVANVKVNKKADAELVAVASDVKIHYVDCTTNAYAVIDSASKVPATDTESAADNQSALAYVQDVNGVMTITDIFVEVDGASAASLWN
ncbi:S-layer homology domain-containing protein [Intestinimonas butyriciproducens]|uniref:S-layer homology domain-containing protein n=1 Tax=Intestinimonas butyriciproducens TaxID=1297617 RepID=UPI0019573C9D|nr:S-layer homology domain-containing protein [Intestinimonas butyriciproducens]MBM6918648.1 S-layer homology domain-containing protein [Intestinimonas butyriciproducens]